MKRLILSLLILLWAGTGWAGTYYIDKRCQYDGDGTASACAAGAGQAGASALTLLIDGGVDGAADTNRYFVSMDGAEAQRPYLSVTYTLMIEGGVPISAPGRMRVSKLRGTMR